MTNDQPKISFIPKTSLVREETFLERPRPRSLLSFLAVVALIASTGAYGVLYAFNYSLLRQVDANVASIQDSQKTFAENPIIDKAKNFQTRAERAQELLDNHVVISPVFRFLKENTLTGIYYTSYSYHEAANDFQVNLTGEARSYTSLAFQSDILHLKTGELVKFAISDVGLTKYGTISFSLKLQFAPRYLSYSYDRAHRNSAIDMFEAPKTATTTATTSVTTTRATTTATTTTQRTATSTTPARSATPATTASQVVVPSASGQPIPTFTTNQTTTTESQAPDPAQATSFTVTTDTPSAAGGVNAPVASGSTLEKFWSLFKFW